VPWAAEATNLVDLASHIRACNHGVGQAIRPVSGPLASRAGCAAPCRPVLFRCVLLQYGWLPTRSSMLRCMQRNRKGVMKATTETAIVLTGARHCARGCVMVTRPMRIKWHTGGCLVDGSGC